MYSDQNKKFSLCKLNEKTVYLSKTGMLTVDQTSLGIEFQTEEEAKENERPPSVALLCAGLLRRDMVYELE